jgi:hypothetical protein
LLTLVFRNERRLFLGGGGLDKVESAVSSFVAPSSSSSSCVTVGFSGKSFSLLIVGITMAFDRPQLLTYCSKKQQHQSLCCEAEVDKNQQRHCEKARGPTEVHFCDFGSDGGKTKPIIVWRDSD